MNGSRAWLTLIAAIAAWEIHAARTDPTLLLSRALDTIRATHPLADIACRSFIIATALHLCRWVSPRYDIYALLRLT